MNTDHLIQLTYHPSPDVRGDAIIKLLDTKSKAAFERGVELLKEDPDEEVRAHAAGSLGYNRYEQAIPALLAGLGDVSQMVRGMAGWGLADIGDASVIEKLEEQLEQETDTVIQFEFCGMLWQLGVTARVDDMLVELGKATGEDLVIYLFIFDRLLNTPEINGWRKLQENQLEELSQKLRAIHKKEIENRALVRDIWSENPWSLPWNE